MIFQYGLYRDITHFGRFGQPLMEHILSTERDINKR